MSGPLPRDLFDRQCPSTATPLQFGDNRAGMLLTCVRDGPRRFSEPRVPVHRAMAACRTWAAERLDELLDAPAVCEQRSA